MTKKSKNPFADRGVCFSEAEYILIDNLVVQILENAKKADKADIAQAMIDLRPRLKQAMHAGMGMSDAAKQKFEQLLMEALQAGDSSRFLGLIGKLLQSSIRLEADPAVACSEIMLSVVATFTKIQGLHVGADPLLLPVIAKLDACKVDIANGWSPTPDALLTYLREWVDFGRQNALECQEPWPTDDPQGDASPQGNVATQGDTVDTENTCRSCGFVGEGIICDQCDTEDRESYDADPDGDDDDGDDDEDDQEEGNESSESADPSQVAKTVHKD